MELLLLIALSVESDFDYVADFNGAIDFNASISMLFYQQRLSQ